jgi:taurine dioxygenase
MRLPDTPSFPHIIDHINCHELADAEIVALLDLLHRSHVVVLRRQTLDADQYAGFIQRLGRTIPHVLANFSLPEHRDILVISNLYNETGSPVGVHEGGCYWHADLSYLETINIFTALYSVKAPQSGGETEFIDCVEGLRILRNRIIKGKAPPEILALDMDHTFVMHQFGNRARLRDASAAYQALTGSQARALPRQVVHPLIMRHPVVGEESLYAVAGTSRQIDGLAEAESCELLDTLLNFLLAEAPQYRHRHERGDIVLWDNVSVLHRGTPIPPSRAADDCRYLFRASIDYLARRVNY